MDIAAAAQVSAAQRTQQISIAALRSSQLQAQSIASILSQAASSASAPANAPQSAGPAVPQTAPNSNTGNASNAPRGSLVNILV